MTTSNLKRPRSLRVAHTAPSTPFVRTTLAIGASTALLAIGTALPLLGLVGAG